MTPMTGFEVGSLALGGANLLGSLSGGTSGRREKRSLRYQYQAQAKYQPDVISANIQGAVDGAKKAGLHPLFALGGSTPSAGGGFSIPGQSESGSHSTQAVMQLANTLMDMQIRRDNADLATAQAELAKMRALEKNLGADNTTSNAAVQSIADEAKNKGSAIVHKVDMKKDTSHQGLVEVKPAEQISHAVGDKSTNPADVSLKRKLWTSNNEFLYIPNVQELDSLMEEPLVALGAIAALNPNLTSAQIKRQLRGLGYKIPEVGNVTNKRILKYKDPFGLLKIYKDIPFKSRGRYAK